MKLYKNCRRIINLIPAETAHNLAISLLKHKVIKCKGSRFYDNILTQNILNLNFINPVGLAAGFDKNAEAIFGLQHSRFGFFELGTVTPKPQAGNVKPRLFRLEEDLSIINRMGFNNKGADNFKHNLVKLQKKKSKDLIIGANIGKNKDSNNDASDYVTMIEQIYGFSDYITINISSPNTKGLRDLQAKDSLDDLLSNIKAVYNRQYNSKKLEDPNHLPPPLILKIAPDLDEGQQEDIASLCLAHQIDAIIISNTTIARDEALKSKYRNEIGGLSGKFVYDKSTKLIGNIYKLTQGKITIIGVGGIFSSFDAYQKIRQGASLIQIYSSLIYNGFSIIDEINLGLIDLLKQDGFSHISEAIGVDCL